MAHALLTEEIAKNDIKNANEFNMKPTKQIIKAVIKDRNNLEKLFF